MLAIYLRKKDGAYIVQPMCRHPTGAHAEYGEPTVIDATDTDQALVPAVRRCLDLYAQQTFLPDQAPSYADEEYTAFIRGHHHVSVLRERSGEIEVEPSCRVAGGYRGGGEAVRLPRGASDAELMTAIREAFKQAE